MRFCNSILDEAGDPVTGKWCRNRFRDASDHCTTARSSQALLHVHCSLLLDAVEAPEWGGFQE